MLELECIWLLTVLLPLLQMVPPPRQKRAPSRPQRLSPRHRGFQATLSRSPSISDCYIQVYAVMHVGVPKEVLKANLMYPATCISQLPAGEQGLQCICLFNAICLSQQDMPHNCEAADPWR